MSAAVLRCIYQRALRPALFHLDAERAHELAASALGLAHRSKLARAALRVMVGGAPDPRLATTCFGVQFRSPVMVAAGFDKRASLYNALGAMGFGAVEVGTITARAQPGNDRPRLFRLPDDRAVINRMGFNNPGAEEAARAIAAHPPAGVVLGVNLGKSKVTALEDAPADYAESARLLGPFADYMVINVSSPNTPGLRSLQSVDALRPIVRAVRDALGERRVPLLVKIAPDLADEDVDAVADLAWEERLAGVVATNTTLSRDGLRATPERVAEIGAGGLSGAPLRRRATAVIARLWRRAGARVPILGAGGIFTADDAWDCLAAGASLVQVYTGLIYEGHTVAGDVARGIAARMTREGFAKVGDVVGSAHR